jgi:F0F1-type ATP synthase membrane subunit b/b'
MRTVPARDHSFEIRRFMELLLPKLGLLAWTLLAFLIVFFLLKKMAWPAIIKGLRDRENSITESLATAQTGKRGNGPDEK